MTTIIGNLLDQRPPPQHIGTALPARGTVYAGGRWWPNDMYVLGCRPMGEAITSLDLVDLGDGQYRRVMLPVDDVRALPGWPPSAAAEVRLLIVSR